MRKNKLNKTIIKQIIFKSAIISVGANVFCALLDFILKHEFSLYDTVITCAQFFVILCLMFIIAPWMRKTANIDDEKDS